MSQDTTVLADTINVNQLLSLLGPLLAASNQSSVANLTSSTTIATNKLVSRTSANGAAVTGMTLGAGTVNGQIVIVTNEDSTAADSITFGTTVASNFVFGAAASTIAGGSMAIFIWLTSLNSGNGAWVRVKAA